MKRSFSSRTSALPLAAGGLALVAATYGLVRLAYGLLLPDVQRDLGLDLATAGAISAGASSMYCACAGVASLLAARHPRTLVVAAGIGGAAGALGMAAAGDVPVFALAAVVASSGAGLASPALVALLARDPATRERPQLQAVVNAGTGPGLAIAAILAIALPDWRSVWLVAAAATAVGAVATLLAGRVDPDDGPGGPRAHATRGEAGGWARAHARALAAALLMGVGSAAVWSFGRTIVVDAGASDLLSLVSWIALGLGGAVTVATAGPLDRLGARRAWALTAVTIAAATGALAVGAAWVPLAIVACAAFGWAYMAGTGALIAWTREIDADRAASGTAVLFVVLVLGQALGAAVVGAVAPLMGLGGAFAGAAIVALASVAAAGVRARAVPTAAH